MRKKVSILAALLAMCILLTLFTIGRLSHQNTDADSLQKTLTSTNSLSDLANFAQEYSVDFTCIPACWSDFMPGKTEMSQIFDLLAKSTGATTYSYSTRGDANLPQNSTGVSSGDIEINGFSDNSQPLPKLRAFAIAISVTGDIQVDSLVKKWLPQALFRSKKLPSKIVYGHLPFSQFYLLMDFNDKWAISYQGPAITSPTQQLLQLCSDKYVSNITIWSYSSNESDILSLINSLGGYSGVEGVSELHIPYLSTMSIIDNMNQIEAFSQDICKQF